MEVTGGSIGMANRRFSNPNDKICPNEFHGQTFSKIIFHEPYRDAILQEIDMFTKTSVTDVLSVDGPICKVFFLLSTNYC